MNAVPNEDPPDVMLALDHLIRAHGVLAVVLALVRRLMQPQRHVPDVEGLNDYLMRDIGLPPHAPQPWRPPFP